METMTKSKAQTKRDDKKEAMDTLREWMPEGTTVYTILRHVSASGMSRDISLVVFLDGQPIHPNYSAAKALEWHLTTSGGHDAIRVGGCGMDMGFHLVDTLAHVLYGNGRALKQEWL